MALSEPRIVCAAIRHVASGALICGPRHFDLTMHKILEQLGNHMAWRGAEQGFIDQHGNYLTRQEAYEIARANGQIIRDIGNVGRTLYSEHLY